MIILGIERIPRMARQNRSKTLRRLGRGGTTFDVRNGVPPNVRWIRGKGAFRLCLHDNIPFLGAYVGARGTDGKFDGVIVERDDEEHIVALLQQCETHSSAFKAMLKDRYPSLPPECEDEIVSWACKVGSDTVGRPGAGVELRVAVERATTSYVRHRRTDYDDLLAAGCSREDARKHTKRQLVSVLKAWASPMEQGVPTNMA